MARFGVVLFTAYASFYLFTIPIVTIPCGKAKWNWWKTQGRIAILSSEPAIGWYRGQDLGGRLLQFGIGWRYPYGRLFYAAKAHREQSQKIDTVLVSFAPIHFEQSEMFWERQIKYNFYTNRI